MINADYTFKKPSIDELKNDFLKIFYANAPNVEGKNSVGIVAILAYSVAGLVYLLWNVMEKYYKELFIMTSSGERIDYWATIVGKSRKQSKKASGEVIFTGKPGAIIPRGTLLQTSSGVIFLTDREVKIPDGQTSVAVKVTAEKDGLLGNTAAGDHLTFISGVPGVEMTAKPAQRLSGGDDLESDESYRKRVAEAFRIRAINGGGDDYISWVREVPGVTTEHRIFTLNRYGVYHGIAVVVLDENGMPIDKVLANAIQIYLENERRKPYTDDVYVLNSECRETFLEFTAGKEISKGVRPGLVLPVEVKLTIKINHLMGEAESVVKANVTKALKDYFREIIYSPKGHAITISAYGGGVGARTGLYNTTQGVRRLTITECKKVMGFPTEYHVSSGLRGYQQLGNAVVPAMISHVYDSIKAI